MSPRRGDLVGALVLGLLLGTPTETRANDTMATVGAGGLSFQKTAELEMTSEELYLSPKQVRVRYVFNNLTSHEVSGTVAFPLPEISVADMSEAPHEFHKSYLRGDVFDFHVEAGGRPVTPLADIHAVVKDREGREKDVTDLLNEYRLPVLDPEAGIGALSPEAIKTLVAAGVLEDDGDHHPRWSVRTAFHWNQVFPARRSTVVVHRYRPVIGGSHLAREMIADDVGGNLAEWCLDRGFLNSVKGLPADNDGLLLTTTLEYVLKTGANWAGPIRSFRLEIDKAGADLVSLCPIPGLKLQRQGQTFVAKASQFMPAGNLKLLFVYRGCDKAPCGLEPKWPGYPR
ncbi:DUF4424 family protein [Bradyrhizobium commune]|uniref:DUF4424 family protein n=1 Tax=Bradyrhizobium commune TaxID=83627 RepID=A0A7S9D8W8_9BRAD|nr:DUF4424 family protein [Bradyrhizobium commune]QPF93297.1 DUF4424 family protein [Bradyrhizobium commune]